MTKRAMIVDDSDSMRAGVAKILSKLGYAIVAEAKNGREAVAQAGLHKPDLIMLDINMPVMTGIEAIAPILATSPGITIIMMTSVSDEQSVEECLSNGAANYVLKSASPEDISKAVLATMEA